MRVKGITAKEKAEQLLRQAEAGEYLLQLRSKKGVSLAQLGEKVGVSANYLSEIERGLKVPSDLLIRELAGYYGTDENIIFKKYGKTPLAAIEEVNDNPTLQKTLTEIRRNKKLTDDQKQELYDKVYELYQEFINKGV
ncbi:predicted transcriptional regulator [Pelotomaculum thermopropionicum SI]|uniref:Predicted transcriptional regulator n=1 Tax=Pelotomaculum thermopropionicum (strain DSM 13744 / JCM 10971 / SI) TaxID=370438 RepID=A5D079_PELTS|nr:predicted transcriptional regulator [Pelotomaculum thermopropionicum SI]